MTSCRPLKDGGEFEQKGKIWKGVGMENILILPDLSDLYVIPKRPPIRR
jgi:hypothetical protein